MEDALEGSTNPRGECLQAAFRSAPPGIRTMNFCIFDNCIRVHNGIRINPLKPEIINHRNTFRSNVFLGLPYFVLTRSISSAVWKRPLQNQRQYDCLHSEIAYVISQLLTKKFLWILMQQQCRLSLGGGISRSCWFWTVRMNHRVADAVPWKDNVIIKYNRLHENHSY